MTTEHALVSHDAEFDGDFDAQHTAYEAVRASGLAPGRIAFVVTPKVAAAIVARMEFLKVCREPVGYWQWDGNGIRFVPDGQDPLSDEHAVWVLPNDDGNYDLTGIGQGFYELERGVDRVFRVVTA